MDCYEFVASLGYILIPGQPGVQSEILSQNKAKAKPKLKTRKAGGLIQWWISCRACETFGLISSTTEEITR